MKITEWWLLKNSFILDSALEEEKMKISKQIRTTTTKISIQCSIII